MTVISVIVVGAPPRAAFWKRPRIGSCSTIRSAPVLTRGSLISGIFPMPFFDQQVPPQRRGERPQSLEVDGAPCSRRSPHFPNSSSPWWHLCFRFTSQLAPPQLAPFGPFWFSSRHMPNFGPINELSEWQATAVRGYVGPAPFA
jgi:hypothetical protein